MPRILEFCCVTGGGCVSVVGCVTVVSRVVVAVVVVGCDEHEAKLSIAVIPSRKKNIFIGEFRSLGIRSKCRTQMYFCASLQKALLIVDAVLLNQRPRILVAESSQPKRCRAFCGRDP